MITCPVWTTETLQTNENTVITSSRAIPNFIALLSTESLLSKTLANLLRSVWVATWSGFIDDRPPVLVNQCRASDGVRYNRSAGKVQNIMRSAYLERGDGE